MYWLEENENIMADDPIVQYVHICAWKRQCIGLGRILYTNENISSIVQCVRVCCQMGSHVVQFHVTTPYMDILIHCSTPWTIHL